MFANVPHHPISLFLLQAFLAFAENISTLAYENHQ